MEMQRKPLIHLWIYNHPYHGISDQVIFFISVFRKHGYRVSVGYQPKDSALNVVIENFSMETRDVLISFCRSTRKRVAIIMTEHLDFKNKRIFIHGMALGEVNDYMHPATQMDRIRYMMDCVPYIRCFFILGDLPLLKNFSKMIPGIDVRKIPFPMFEAISKGNGDNAFRSERDLLFTGVMTEYRSILYGLLEENGFVITCPKKFVSVKKRNALNRSVKVILNLPQRADWRWLSSMRIIAGLRSGRTTVSLGTNDNSKISACTYQLDMSDQGWLEILKGYVENWSSLYKTAYENYILMAREYEQLNEFPHDMLEYWAITDQLTIGQ